MLCLLVSIELLLEKWGVPSIYANEQRLGAPFVGLEALFDGQPCEGDYLFSRLHNLDVDISKQQGR